MKIVITTGIFEPESGGPATYTPALARRLAASGHDVTVITFSPKQYAGDDSTYPFKLVRVTRGNKIINRFTFFSALVRHVRTCDLVYSLDWFSVGLPVAIACSLLRKPYALRIGGDYAWEQKYLESGKQPIPLKDFYERGIYQQFPYKIFFIIIKFVLSHSQRAVFNSDQERELYEKFFQIRRDHTAVIYNPRPEIALVSDKSGGASSKEFVYWGRLIVMKNVESLVRAFAAANIPGYSLAIIGDGTRKSSIERLIRESGMSGRIWLEPGMPQKAVLERVRNARAFILPSWTDISPNQVFEALAIGLPALVTRENYLPIRDQLPAMIDPNSVEDIARGLEMLAGERAYADFSRRFLAMRFDHDWQSVTGEHERLFNNILGKDREGVRVLSIGADRSKRGILYPESPAAARQKAYGEGFDALDIIGFSLRSDARVPFEISPKVRIYPTNSFSRIFYGLDTMRIMRRLPRPDVITVQDPFETGLLGLLLSRMYRIPLHVQLHTDFTAPEYAAHSVVNRVRTWIASSVVRRASRIRVVSSRVKESLLSRHQISCPITVLPIFTDIEKFKNMRPDASLHDRFSTYETKLLVVARLEPEKNVALAIRSFAQGAPSNSCLIIVGTGSEQDTLKKLAEELKIEDRVFFEGERAALDYYPLADLVLVTSAYEGYGLVIIEALASGKPVLSRDVGVAREAGATTTSSGEFPDALAGWFKNGPREMHLNGYQYKDFDDYRRRYCEDIAACAQAK